MSHRAVQLGRIAAVMLLPIIATGCGSSELKRAAKAQMERAQATYKEAEADPNAQTYAQLRLVDAEKALRAAEGAKEPDERLHLGYVAERKAQLAMVTGATARTEQSLQQKAKETSDLLLQKRERELKAAREATRAGTTTQNGDAEARRAAEARAREAEAKAREADTKAREAAAREQAARAALTNELASLKAAQTDRGLVLTVGDVLFDAGKAEVAPGAQRSIDKLAEFLNAHPQRSVLIEGHSDNTGAEDFNVKLSQQRADAVRDRLVARGVSAQRIQTKGYGARFPVVDNDTPAGRQQNRRVEVVVLNEGVRPGSAAR
jgi:outer membrane protein OmpA-like peptidoglycan-associated protein